MDSYDGRLRRSRIFFISPIISSRANKLYVAGRKGKDCCSEEEQRFEQEAMILAITTVCRNYTQYGTNYKD